MALASVKIENGNRSDPAKLEAIRSKFSQIIRDRPYVEPVKPAICQNKAKLTLSERKKMNKVKSTVETKAPLTAYPKTFTDKVSVNGDTRIIQRTNSFKRVLVDLKISEGAYLDKFQKDYETINMGLRSPSLETAVSGGESLSIPLARLEAAQRIKDCQIKVGAGPFAIVEAVIFKNLTPTKLSEGAKISFADARVRVIMAFNAVQAFYDPAKTRPDRSSIRIAEFLKKSGNLVR